MADKLTSITPELLAMRWPSAGAARMYLNRRGTNPDKLGVTIGMAPDAGVCVEPRTAQPAPAAAAPAAPVKPAKAAKPVKAKPAKADAAPAVYPFEAWAREVDALLLAQHEAPVAESLLKHMFASGITPAAAVADVIGDRAGKLEASIAESPAVIIRGAPERSSAIAAAQIAELEAGPDTPAPAPDAVVTVRIGDQFVAHVPTAPDTVPGHVFLQIGGIGAGMERSAGMLWAGQCAKRLKVDIHVCDAASGQVVHTVHAKAPRAPRDPGQARTPREPRDGGYKRKADRLATVVSMMERPGGASGEEVQAALAWATTPGTWFFRQWVDQAGRAADWIEPVKVDGVRRYALRTAAAAPASKKGG